MQVRKQQLELDMEKQTGSKSAKEYIRAVYCLFNNKQFNLYAEYIMRNAWLEEAQAGTQDCWEKYQYPQICRWHHPYGRKQRTKEPLDESEGGEFLKVGLKLNIRKMKIMASSPITSWQIDG